jgi:N-acetylglucosamine-6-phosphate deacetylase
MLMNTGRISTSSSSGQSSLLIINGRIITPEGRMRWLHSVDGRITALGSGEPPPEFRADRTLDAGDLLVLPGFIDLHIHGSAGYDVMDATPEAIFGMSRFLAEHGVTAFLPTTLTHPQADLLSALENIRACMTQPSQGAKILGARLEGPWLNAEKCGAQNPEHIRTAVREEVIPLLETGIVRIVDVAPEIEANFWLIAECRARGIVPSIAHTSATAEQAAHAFRAGITQSTHTFNAQTPLHHRAPGVVGAVLSEPDIYAELIADGVHVHLTAMRVLNACKRPDHLLLISDAVRAAGMPEGEYRFDSRRVLHQGGAVRLPDGTLAGSSLTMDRALRIFTEAVGASPDETWKTASRNPAHAIGIGTERGTIRVGSCADLVLVDDAFAVQCTLVEGEIVYQRQ